MPISAVQFAAHYPRLYHMAEAGAWPSIMKYGLLSTTSLLDLFEVDGGRREAIEATRRAESVELSHEVHGAVLIRDQIPMRDAALRRCLRGMTLEEWYRMLNGQVFFWVSRERVQTLLDARAYRGRLHAVITIDTGALLARYADRILLSPINSGSTIYNPHPRGPDTFRRLQDYPFDERRRLRGLRNAVAEVAVPVGVPDLRDFTMSVEHRRGPEKLEVVYRAK